jgi:branched-chain amino acid transport system permease protein
MEIFGVPSRPCWGQLLLGLINGSFYAMLSLGLASSSACSTSSTSPMARPVHDGRLRRLAGLTNLGVNYWVDAAAGPAAGRPVRRAHRAHDAAWLYKLDHLYGLLLTFGLALIIEGFCSATSSASPGQPYDDSRGLPAASTSASCSCPIYRAWVIVASLVVCLGTWYMIEKTRLGAYLRAGTENPSWSRPSASTCR